MLFKVFNQVQIIVIALMLTLGNAAFAGDPDSVVDECKSRGLKSDLRSRRVLYDRIVGDGEYIGSTKQNIDLLRGIRRDGANFSDYSQLQRIVESSDTCLLYSLAPNVGVNSMRVTARATVTGDRIRPHDLMLKVDGHPNATFSMAAQVKSPTHAVVRDVTLVELPTITLPESGPTKFNAPAIDVSTPTTIQINAQGYISDYSSSGYLGKCSTEIRFP